MNLFLDKGQWRNKENWQQRNGRSNDVPEYINNDDEANFMVESTIVYSL